MKEIATVAPAYAGISWDALDWGDGREGVLVPDEGATQPLRYVPVDANLRSLTNRLSLHLARVLYDDGVATRMSPSLAALMPQARVYLHPRDAGSLGLQEGDVVEVRSDSGSVELPMAVDESLAVGAVYLPANLPETAAVGAAIAVSVSAVREEPQ